MTAERAGGSPLLRRTVTALVAVPLFLAALYWDGWWWSGLLLLAALLAAGEWIGLTRRAGFVPAAPVILPGTVLVYGAAVYRQDLLPGVVALVSLGALAAQLWGPARPHAIANAGVTLLGPLYVSLFAALDLLRRLSDGLPWTFLVVVAVWVADSAAYFAGRSFGRRLLTPISPKKTWEGVWSGVLGGIVGAVSVAAILRLPLGLAAGIGALAGSLGLIGDLSESALKRAAGVKDTGGLLPGHGGLLDRFDALLFVAPAAYAVLRGLR